MFARFTRWLPLAVVVLAALWLRTHQLAARPMHSDEANQAVKVGDLLEGRGYAFDPRDHHGPTLYYAALPVAWIRGDYTLAALRESTVRLVPALAGTIAVLLLIWAASPLGRWPALAAGAFLAVSPPSVYYSRYFIQETLLLTAVLAAAWAGQRWWRSGRTSWAAAAGAAIGCMFATKATAPLFLVAAAIGLLAARPSRPRSDRIALDLLAGLVVALAVAALFLSSFGAHPAGVRDAIAAYGFGTQRASSGAGHDQPWWYYLRLFGLQRHGGLVWQQLGFSAFALCGAALTLLFSLSRRKPAANAPVADHKSGATGNTGPAPRTEVANAAAGQDPHAPRLLLGVLAYTVIVVLGLSVVPYKTPWHVIHFVPGLCVLAAGALALMPRARMGLLLGALVLFMQAGQTWLAAFQRPADARNPYAYVHSSPDVLKLRGLVEAALARTPSLPVRVIGDEYWPIPWYVRGLDRVGYWTTAPDDCDGALVLASGSQVDVVRARLRGHYRESYLGLRPDVLCVVFTPMP